MAEWRRQNGGTIGHLPRTRANTLNRVSDAFFMSKPPFDKRIAVARAIEVADNQYIPVGYAEGLPDDISDRSAWVADAAIRAMRPVQKETERAVRAKHASQG